MLGESYESPNQLAISSKSKKGTLSSKDSRIDDLSATIKLCDRKPCISRKRIDKNSSLRIIFGIE